MVCNLHRKIINSLINENISLKGQLIKTEWVIIGDITHWYDNSSSWCQYATLPIPPQKATLAAVVLLHYIRIYPTLIWCNHPYSEVSGAAFCMWNVCFDIQNHIYFLIRVELSAKSISWSWNCRCTQRRA